MKAAVFHDVEDIRVERVDDPTPGPDDVVVEVSACGICGSDLKFYEGHSPLPTPDGKGPMILGHEFAGRVVAVGRAVSTLQEGDRVAVNPVQSRAGLDASRSGNPHFDIDTLVGVNLNGGFAQFARSRAEHVYRLPDTVSDEQGALVEMLASSVHAVEKADVRFGDLVVIFGPGPVGLSMIPLAAARGATVAVVGTRDYRLARALELGARHVYNPSDPTSSYHTGDLAGAIAEARDGELAERAIIATAAPAAARLALEATGYGAVVVFMGFPEADDSVVLPLLDCFVKEKTVTFSLLYPNLWPRTIRALREGLVPIERLVTHEVGLGAIGEAFRQLVAREDGVIKTLVRPAN
jgi:L-iditol 2-dehydrogenase